MPWPHVEHLPTSAAVPCAAMTPLGLGWYPEMIIRERKAACKGSATAHLTDQFDDVAAPVKGDKALARTYVATLKAPEVRRELAAVCQALGDDSALPTTVELLEAATTDVCCQAPVRYGEAPRATVELTGSEKGWHSGRLGAGPGGSNRTAGWSVGQPRRQLHNRQCGDRVLFQEPTQAAGETSGDYLSQLAAAVPGHVGKLMDSPAV